MTIAELARRLTGISTRLAILAAGKAAFWAELLARMRDYYLRNAELKEDGSGAPHVLAARVAVRAALTAEVWYFA